MEPRWSLSPLRTLILSISFTPTGMVMAVEADDDDPVRSWWKNRGKGAVSEGSSVGLARDFTV